MRRDITSRRSRRSAFSIAAETPSTPGWPPGLCTCVLQTDMVDLAGVAPIMIYLADEDRVVTISGLGRWPRAASVEYFRTRHGGHIPVGVERSITPAAPDAWITALSDSAR